MMYLDTGLTFIYLFYRDVWHVIIVRMYQEVKWQPCGHTLEGIGLYKETLGGSLK